MSQGAITFVADASQLTTASAEAAKSVSSVAVSAEDARKRITASYAAQVAAAKEAGASQAQLASISNRAANQLASVTEDSARRYINSIDRMEERTRKFNAARIALSTSIPQQPESQFTFAGYGEAAGEAKHLSKAIDGVAESTGYAVAPSVRFGSVLRGMEGGFTRNIRSAEYFGASLKFLGPIMETAFPIVGAATLGYALYEMGKNAYNAFENVVLLRDAIKGLNQLQINVDSTVQKNADAAESSVEAILRSGPGGKTAADRQKYSYDQSKPLDNSSYFYSKEFAGLDSNIKADYERRFKSIAPGDINSSQSAINAELAQLEAAKSSQRSQGAFVQKVGGYGPSASQDPQSYYDARIKALQQIKALTGSGATSRSASLQADQSEIPHDQAEAIKKKAQEAKSARQEALAAQAQLNAKAIAQQNQNFLEWQSGENRSKADTVLYWSSIVALTNDGSKRALDANKKYQEAQVALNRENAEAMKSAISSFSSDYMKDFYASSGLNKQDTLKLNSDGAANEEWITALRDSIDLTKQNKDTMAEYSIQMAVATGQMTKLDAARATAALHSQEYQNGLKDFADNEATIKADPTLDAAGKRAAFQQNANARGQFIFQGQQQSLKDQQAINPSYGSAGTGAKEAINDFVNASRDAAGQMRDLVSNTLQGLNQQIVGALSGQKTDFGDFGAGVFRSVASTALTKGEGALLSTFGGGKLGSKGNPIYTINAGASVGSSAASALGTLIPSSKGSGVAGFFGGIMKTVLPFLATGGDFNNGAIVGENGPELLTGSGHITPNHTLKSMLGSSGNGGTTVYIDASGSTDPAQTRVQVTRGIQAAAPHIAASAVHAQAEQNKRKPASKRS